MRLVGDDRQLGAVGPSGILTDLTPPTAPYGSPTCTASPIPPKPPPPSRSARGHPDGLGYYADHGRIHVGDPAVLSQQLPYRLGRPTGRPGWTR